MNLLVTALGPGLAGEPMNTDEENVAAAAPTAFNLTENGYLVEQFTRPETTGYALLDSPRPDGPVGAGSGRPSPSRSRSAPSPVRSSRRRAAGFSTTTPTLGHHNKPDSGWHFTSGSSRPGESIT
jgi:hypothetical protein